VAASVDCDECETMPDSDLDRCLDVTGHYERRAVGTVEHEGRLAIAHSRSQIDHLACTKMQQLLRRHLAQRCGPRISPGDFADTMRAHSHSLSSHKRQRRRPYGQQPKRNPGRSDVCTHRALSASTEYGDRASMTL
jgi:hypothetical protein